MKRTLSKLSAVGLALVALLTACQKEEHPGRLELTAEGLGNGAKMYVNGLTSYWQTGDKVNINGVESTITASGEQAYINGEFSADNYCIVFPSSIYQNKEGNVVTVDMPSKYEYKQQYIAGVGSRQILDAPMAYLGSAEGGKVKMMHLTGALNVQISGPSGIVIDRIVVGTTQNRVMSGSMTFDLTNLEGFGSSATNASANNTIEMIGGATGTVQIPIPVLTGNVNFTIVVEGHVEGTKYTFSRTQTTGGHLGRGIVGTVAVNLNEGQTGVTTSALFPTSIYNGITFYEISSARELCLMSDAILGTSYREDGDWYTRKWEYGGLYYNEANYRITHDIDMSGMTMGAIVRYNGTFNGDNHTISNLTVLTRNVREELYHNHGGLFVYGSPTVSFVNIDGLTVSGAMSEDGKTYIGALFGATGWESGTWANNVSIRNFKVSYHAGDYENLMLGGIIGHLGGSNRVTLRDCNVSFSEENTFPQNNCSVMTVGGVAAPDHTGSNTPLSLNGISVDFGTMAFSGSGTHYFGGLYGRGDNSNVVAENVTVSGDIRLPAANTYAYKIYPIPVSSPAGLNLLSGINVNGLTITTE